MNWNRRLLVVALSVVVAFVLTASLSSSAYADDEKHEVEFPTVRVINDRSSSISETQVDKLYSIRFDCLGTNVAHTGTCDFVFESFQNGAWSQVSSVSTPMDYGTQATMILIGAAYKYGTITVNHIILDVGTYRVKASYSGDDYWLPVETGWYEFSVIPAPTPPLPPKTPSSDSIPDPAPPAKATPVASVAVASGGVKSDKLSAALAEPTASFSLAPVGGVYPTGSADFTLQVKSGGKWKALSQKAVALTSGKASYKLAKATDAATYRLQVSYSGDSKYNALTTAWETVKIAKGNGITKKTLKVYSKASTKAKKLTTFKKGKKIVITGKNGKFYEISFKLKGKSRTGYVLKTSIKVKK
jgi:hypothetical protein